MGGERPLRREDPPRQAVVGSAVIDAGVTVVFALGANLGDPIAALRHAATRLAASLREVRVSAVYATPAFGDADQPDYLNAVVAGKGDLSPRQALELARSLETEMGRERPFAGAPRTLDVDVLFVGGWRVDEPDLQVPHPRWRSRTFVGVPLLDVAPDLVDPESGATVAEIARREGWRPATFPMVLEVGALISPEAG